jgi:uncharacterized protein with PIN domain
VLRVADTHLDGLARLLRMSGFDTFYDNAFEDGEIAEIAEIAVQHGPIVLTRDRELFERLDLARCARPFSLCLHCNLPLHEISPERARPRVPPRIAALHSHFLPVATRP